MVAAGTYEERLTLGSYSRTSGYIVIQAATDSLVTITCENGNLVIARNNSYWNLKNITLKHDIYAANNGIGNYYHTIAASTNSVLIIEGCTIKTEYTGDAPSSGSVAIRIFSSSSSSQLSLILSSTECLIEYHKGNANYMYVFYADGGGNIRIEGSNDISVGEEIVAFGECTAFAMITGGSLTVNSSYLVNPVFYVPADESATGMRYNARSGGTISTGGKGAEYFPGDTAGTVESNTYSWYK